MVSEQRKIIFFQPAAPEYRKDFFDRLSTKYNLEVYASIKDFLGVLSYSDRRYLMLDDGFHVLPFGLFLSKAKMFSIKYNANDLVVINGNPRILNYMLLLIFLKIKRVKVVWWGHGWTAGSHGIASKIRLQIMKLADARLVYTDQEKEKIKIKNTFALNNGLKLVETIERSMPFMRTFNNKIRLIFIGRITDKANLNLLLIALARLANNQKFELHVIGAGPGFQDCRLLSESLGLKSSVIWHGSIFDEDKITKIMTQSDFFIYPGSVGLSLIHAFNYALPAIVHSDSFTHMPEFSAFRDRYNGFAFEKDDVDSLSKVLCDLSTLTCEDYLALSQNARNTVCNTFNTSDMAIRFDCLVKEVSEW